MAKSPWANPSISSVRRTETQDIASIVAEINKHREPYQDFLEM